MSHLKLLIALLALLGTPLAVHGATPDPCRLLSEAEVGTVLPKAGAPSHVPQRAANGASTEGCAWIRGLDSLALMIITAPKARLEQAFEQQLAAGGTKIDKLGERAAFASRVKGSGEIVVLVGDSMIGLTLSVRGAEQQKSALESLARKVLDRW